MKPNPSSKSPILRIKSSLWSIVYKNPPSKSLESPENYFKIHTITKGLYGQNQAESNIDPRYYNLDKNRNFVDKIRIFFKQPKYLILSFVLIALFGVITFSVLFRS